MENIIKTIRSSLVALGMMAFATNAWAEYTDDCITFSSEESFTLATEYGTKGWDGTLWTSTDKTNWAEWNGEEVSAAQTGETGPFKLHVRGGTDNACIMWDYQSWILAGDAGIACSGNIETLRGATGDEPSTTPMDEGCYSYMFLLCPALTSAPSLPATTLSEYCYCKMFQGCTSLTNAPALPAESLTFYGYSGMFLDCTSLTAAPELPTTNLAAYCYSRMFEGCTSLTNAPALPAETLASSCYGGMFVGCTSLTAAPSLPAMALADNCYFSMFSNCTSLVAAPALPATALEEWCYAYMFSGCTSLEVNETEPGKEWKIPATSSKTKVWGVGMFAGTAGTLQGQPALNKTYYIASEPKNDDCITFSSEEAFSLKTADNAKYWDGTLWTSTDKTNWTEWDGSTVYAEQAGGMYNLYVRGNTSNSKIAYGTAWKLAGSADIACTGNIETLRGATGNNPSPTPMADDCYRYMFDGCTLLANAPALPATTLSQSCYLCMFSGCTSLTNAPVLPAMNLASYCYYKMFMDCTSLTNAPALPAKALADCCYCGMFDGCTSLTTVPALPATILADYCYNNMFLGCTLLRINTAAPGKEWKIPVESTMATDWGEGMFEGTAGTLQGQPALNTTYYIASALPKGSEGNPWQIGAGAGDTVNAWTNGTGTLVVEGAGKMMAFASDGSDVPWPTGEVVAVEISGEVTSIGQNAWLGLGDGVMYNGLSATAAKTMGNGFGGTVEYGRTTFREFLVDGGSIQATVALETAKSLTNEWTEVELTDGDVRVENGRIVITHETNPQAQGFYLVQPVD